MHPFKSLTSLTFALALAACSARGGGGGGGTPIDDDASTATDNPTVDPGTCATLCARVAMTNGCNADTASCMTGCSTLFAVGGACASESAAFAACAQTSQIVCSGDMPNFTSCASQQSMLLACISSPQPDASVQVDSAVTPDAPAPIDSSTQPDSSVRPDVTVGPDASPTDLCNRVCSVLAATPGCSGVSCAGMCGTLSSLPPACAAPVNAFLACAVATTPTCSGSTPSFPACASLQSEITRCLGGTVDAGVDTGTPPAITAACTDTTWGSVDRECGWRSAGTFTCTVGASVTVGCNSTAGTGALCTSSLGSCSGDPVLRVCPGTGACSSTAAITNVDDSCGTCPVAQFTCPAGGRYTVFTGDYSNSTAGTCTVSTR